MSTYPLTAVDGSTLAALFDQKGMHVLAFATCFGVNLWQTVSGGVANKNLPRQHFRTLQTAIFPPYFTVLSTASLFLLLSQSLLHPPPSITSLFLQPLSSGASLQMAIVALHFACVALNAAYVGPRTLEIMKQRERLEKDEGKGCHEEGVSDAMKVVNKEFSVVHGATVVLDLGAFLLIAFHGLWIGRYGV